jgi:RNA-directed DNA polymerase
VLEADIQACFDEIGHTPLLARMRHRIKDKRVLGLVKAFLKSGVMTAFGGREETLTGTPQGGILSPLLANIALSALDEQLMAPWKPGGTMSTGTRRHYRRGKGLPTWRLVRYADDFVVLVHGTGDHADALREDVARILAPLGLRLSPAKTQVVHMSDGFDFLGFHIQWRCKKGSNKWYVYTFIAKRPIRSLKTKIRALTRRTSQLDLGYVLTRLNQVMHGWANYFRHAVAKHTFNMLDTFTFWRVVSMIRKRHRWGWKQFRRHHVLASGQWLRPNASGVELQRIAAVRVTRYRWRGTKIPNPWTSAINA